jgi:hypothetical protein
MEGATLVVTVRGSALLGDATALLGDATALADEVGAALCDEDARAVERWGADCGDGSGLGPAELGEGADCGAGSGVTPLPAAHAADVPNPSDRARAVTARLPKSPVKGT